MRHFLKKIKENNMWIRSQNEYKLINSQFIWMSGFNIIVSVNGDMNSGITFGRYESEKRCKEILNEIEDSIMTIDVDIIYHMPKE
jgi:hypothetical protein